MKYRIVSEIAADRTEKIVNALIASGWVPLGGVCVAETPDGLRIYSQAMTLSE